MFSHPFQFKGHMTNLMRPEFCANSFFDLLRISVCYNVHGGIVVLAVHAPDMKMMDIQNTLKLHKMLLKLVDINSLGRFLKKQIQDLLQSSQRIDQNKDSNANGQHGIQ